jgi:PKD repeat protein
MEKMCLKQRVLYYIIILMLVMVLIVLPVSAIDVVVGCEIIEFCNGQCVNLQTDQYNCGSCGNSCIGSQVCQNGHCIANIVVGSVLCFLPSHNCNDQCVDLQTDQDNCGSCGNSCIGSQVCQNGHCVFTSGSICAYPLASCNGQCVNTQTDMTNCGDCGTTCTYGQTCVNGACNSPPNLMFCTSGTACGTNCVDIDSDTNNCGDCGTKCTTGQTCINGGCTSQQTLYCTPVTANINADPTSGSAPLAVTFHDQTAGVTQVHWDFGDTSKTDSSGLTNQPHTYNKAGTYTPTITVKNDCGSTDTEQIIITVQQSQSFTNTGQSSGTAGSGQSSGTTGSLQISTNPSGAAIILDGNNKGTTPATISGLTAGTHSVKLTMSGYYDYSQDSVTVAAGKTTPVNGVLISRSQPAPSAYSTQAGMGTIVVTSSPPGANVYLDGKSSGKTPITIPDVIPGTHTILLTMQGYSDTSRSVDVSAGSQNQISVDLGAGKKIPGFEAVLAIFSIAGLVAFRMLNKKEENLLH